MSQPKATRLTPATRLTEIWRVWGMKQPDAEAKAQLMALDAVGEFLQGGPSALLRGMQAVLVDPDEAGASKRPLFESLWAATQEHWPAAGTDDGDVMLLQAMLLAADWPSADQGRALGTVLLSPWMAMRGRNKQFDHLQPWLNARASEEVKVEDPSAAFPASIKAGNPTTLALNVLAKMQAEQHAAQEARGANVFLVPSGFNALKEAAHAAVTESNDRVTVLHDQTQHRIDQVYKFASKQSKDSNTLEYLWWGQARYCHTLQTPFRRIGSPQKTIWLAAMEAAERAANLPVEPSASYLQEVMHGLGLATQDKCTLDEYIAQLREVVAELPRPTVPRTLSELVMQDAFGVPISLMCADPKVSDDRLRKHFGIAPDTEIDLGEWISWMFREFVFLRRWPEQS